MLLDCEPATKKKVNLLGCTLYSIIKKIWQHRKLSQLFFSETDSVDPKVFFKQKFAASSNFIYNFLLRKTDGKFIFYTLKKHLFTTALTATMN